MNKAKAIIIETARERLPLPSEIKNNYYLVGINGLPPDNLPRFKKLQIADIVVGWEFDGWGLPDTTLPNK